MTEAGFDVASFLSRLVRARTVNPPGNETEAALIVREVLADAGIDAELVERDPGRANLIATLAPEADAPPIVLLSHLDVVGDGPRPWSFDAFAGDEHDGVIRGRGTLDTKQLTAMQVHALLLLKRREDALVRPVVLVATADEEAGSAAGAGFLARTRPELFSRAGTTVVSEGGGFPLVDGGRVVYPITAGEKGSYRFRIRALGPGGHASSPPGEHALLVLAGAVRRLASASESFRFAHDAGPLADRFAAALGTMRDRAGVARDLCVQIEGVSASVNRVAAGDVINAVATEAIAEVELRVPPGVAQPDIDAAVGDALDGAGVELDEPSYEPGFLASTDTDLYAAIEREVARVGGIAAPMLALGRTDGRFFGHRGAHVYGFSPVLADASFDRVLTMVHGADERISRASLEFGAGLLARALESVCARGR